MPVILYFILLISNLLFAIYKRQSKIIALLTSLFILVFFVGSQGTVDLDHYLNSFATSYKNTSDGIQITYKFFQTFFLTHGYDFYEFRLAVTIVFLVCLFIFATKISSCLNLIYATYLLYLFVMDDIQFRNFWACSLLYLGMWVLFSKIKTKKTIFALLILLASTIHVAFLAYLLFLAIPLDLDRKQKCIKLGSVFFALSIFFLFFRKYLSFLSDVLLLIDSGRAEGYAQLNSNYGGAYFIIMQLIVTLYFVYQYHKEYDGKNVYFIGADNKLVDLKKTMYLFMCINLLSFCYCSFIVFSTTFYRLLRNMFLINVSGFYISSLKRNSNFYWIPLILYLLFWVWLDITPNNHFKLFVVPIFANNYIINDIF